MSSRQKWYQKATVQSALVGGVFVIGVPIVAWSLSRQTQDPNDVKSGSEFKVGDVRIDTAPHGTTVLNAGDGSVDVKQEVVDKSGEAAAKQALSASLRNGLAEINGLVSQARKESRQISPGAGQRMQAVCLTASQAVERIAEASSFLMSTPSRSSYMENVSDIARQLKIEITGTQAALGKMESLMQEFERGAANLESGIRSTPALSGFYRMQYNDNTTSINREMDLARQTLSQHVRACEALKSHLLQSLELVTDSDEEATSQQKEVPEYFSRASKLSDKGFQYFIHADYEKAIQCYNQALELIEDSNAIDDNSKRIRALVLGNRAAAFAQTKKYPEALADYTAALKELHSTHTLRDDPQGQIAVGKLLSERGLVHAKQGSTAKAKVDVRKAIATFEPLANKEKGLQEAKMALKQAEMIRDAIGD